MMRAMIAGLGAVLLAMTPAFALDISGKYKVVGKSPDDNSYSGTATVTKTGETYRVVWDIGGTKYIGTGIGEDGFIAVAYKADANDTGICLLATKDGNLVNVAFAYAGGKKLGGEQWTR